MLFIVSLLLLIPISVIAYFYYQIFEKHKDRKRIAFDEAYEKIRAQNYPPAFPNGWFNLCSSDMVEKGKVIEVEAFGQKLAVFRGEDGKVGVVNVYCPHLNANLADGKVVGNNLVCPFHAWEFGKDGKCKHVPYSDKVPNASTECWIVKENWGLILVWYHAQKALPTWDTEGYLTEMSDFKYHGKTSDILRIHLQDFAENGADHAHFAYVHNLMTIPFVEHIIDVKHKLEIVFLEGKEKHMAYFTDVASLVWKKSQKEIPRAGGHAKVTYFGPGFLVFQFTTEIGNVLLIKTFTPLGPLKLRMDDYVYAPKGTFKLAIKYLLREASAQFHDDIAIWEKKNYAERPVLVKGDGPIMKMRAWYSQFYSEQPSVKDSAVVEESLLSTAENNN